LLLHHDGGDLYGVLCGVDEMVVPFFGDGEGVFLVKE
jgi:hypothetical protein